MWKKLLFNLRVISILLDLNMGNKNKHIKRMIKNPERARCRKCNSRMDYHSDGTMNDYFVCSDDKCNNRITIKRDKHKKKQKDKPSFQTYNLDRTLSDKNLVEKIIDTDNLTFELNLQKVSDMYYLVVNSLHTEEVIEYNPILRIERTMMGRHSETKEIKDEVTHEHYLKIIEQKLRDAIR